MSFGGRLARGLLQGAAGYYGKVAESQERDRLAEAQEARATARSQLDAQLLRQQTDYAGTVATRTYRENKGADVDAELAVLPAKTRATITANQASQATEQAYRIQIETLKHKFNLSEIEARALADIERDNNLAGQVDRFEITADGKGVLYNKKGQAVHVTDAGAFNPPNVHTNDDGDGLDSGRGTPPPPARPVPRSATPDYSQFNLILSQAAQHPTNRGKSAEQIRRETIALAKKSGIPAPDR